VLLSTPSKNPRALYKVADARAEPGTAPGRINAGSKQGRRRILLIQTQAENAGAQEISRLVGTGLRERGYEVFNLFFFRKSDSFDEPPNTIYCAPQRPCTPLAFARFLVSLARQIRAIRPDAVMTFQHYGNIIGGAVSRLVSSAPVIANEVSAGASMKWPVRAADIALGSLGVFKCITLNSRDMERAYARYPASYRARMTHVAHGFDDKSVDLSREEARRRFGLPQQVTLLGCTARLHRDKRLGTAIRLLAREPYWHLALAGQGADEERLRDLAAELQVTGRVHFVGELSPQRIGEFLACLDVFVFPSAAETFGLAAVEAAAAGIPAVVADLPVLREVLVIDGKPTALFVDPDDTAGFAAAVSSVRGHNGVRNELRQNSEGLKSRYSVNAMVDEYVGILQKFL
jgi:glycosyltransferase involved in cell wall biosynthesis